MAKDPGAAGVITPTRRWSQSIPVTAPLAPVSGSEVPYDPGRTYFLRSGAVHRFVMPADWMTIVFTGNAAADQPFPRYELRSTDGVYTQVKTPADDLVPGNAWLELRFEHLLPARRYDLVRFDDETISTHVFRDQPFETIVDRTRAMHDELEAHGYAALAIDIGEAAPVPDWEADDEVERG
jgi:hypothetical protein